MAPVKIWQGQYTPWWLMSTIYLFYFFIALVFLNFLNQQWGLVLQILLGVFFVVAFAWNHFHTPRQGPQFKTWHVFMGRVALGKVTLLVISGYFLVLSVEYSFKENAKMTFMVTGAFQLLLQGPLVLAIR